MAELLVKIIPLDLASTLSPGILALVIFLLGSKRNPKVKTAALFFGILSIGIVITILGFTLGKAVGIHPQPGKFGAILDLILGIFFLIFAIKLFISRDKERKIKEEEGPHFAKWFIVGIIIAAINFDAMFLNFTAGKEVGQSDINNLAKIVFLVINLFFFTLPIILPVFFYLIVPNTATRVLSKLNSFVLKYSRYILAILFIIFGVFLLFRGIKILI